MPKFQKGQTVWGAALWAGKVVTDSATVVLCGEKAARLDGSENSKAFGFLVTIPVSEVHSSELEALQHLAAKADTARADAEDLVRRAERERSAVADAIARLAGAK